MDNLTEKVKKVAQSYVRPSYNGQMFPTFDDEHQSYAVFATGQLAGEQYYSLVLHLQIVDGYVVIHAHNTDADIVADLVAGGIPPEFIKQPAYVV